MVVYTCAPKPWEAGVRGLLGVQGQPEPQSETLSCGARPSQKTKLAWRDGPALTALAKDPGLILCIYVVAHNYL